MRQLLSDKTLIPLGLAVIAIGGGSMWLTTVHAQLMTTASEIQILKSKQDLYNTDIMIIKVELAEIRGELKRLTREQ